MNLEFYNCTFGWGLGLNSYGGDGRSTCKIVNCKIPSIYFANSDENNSTELINYPANNNEWELIGGGNDVTNILTSTSNGEALMLETNSVDEQISISGSAVDVLFGDYDTIVGDGRIEGKIIGYGDVRDTKMGYPVRNLDIIQMWKRLGDCSGTPKILYVTVGADTDTCTFTADYETLETAEATIIATVNDSINNATLSKYNAFNNYDRIHLEDKKIVLCDESGGVLKHELVYAPLNVGALADSGDAYYDVTGIALNDAAEDEHLEVWTGNYYFNTFSDGEYGVGNDNTLSKTATPAIGYVKTYIFYPYY